LLVLLSVTISIYTHHIDMGMYTICSVASFANDNMLSKNESGGKSGVKSEIISSSSSSSSSASLLESDCDSEFSAKNTMKDAKNEGGVIVSEPRVAEVPVVLAGGGRQAAGGEAVHSVSSAVVSTVRKQMQMESANSDGSCDSSDSDDEENCDAADGDTPYHGSTILHLEAIECKIGNKRYRFDRAKGFIEV
jgi:hypothetical protein